MSIKLLATECRIYVLAMSLSVSNWLFWPQPLDSQAVEMNMEHPKNGTERALILHSWLISKWTWASRHIFRISHIHTQRGFPPSYPPGSEAISAKSHQIGVSPLSAPAECLDTAYLMHDLSTTSSFDVKSFIGSICLLLDLYFWECSNHI